MPNKMIEDYVDIYSFPTPYEAHPTGDYTQIISGDLHGNAIKILFLAVKHGITSNLSPSKYEHFVAIYKKSFTDLQAEDLLQFNQLLNETEFKTEATIHWLGDMLADRGGNDFLTLLILKRLHQCGVKFEIILSNHDFEFIANYENAQSDFSSARILNLGPSCNSMIQMHKLLRKGLISRAEINILMQEIYLPALKVLSYTIDEINEKVKVIRLLSHAPVGINCLAFLARQFDVSYNVDSLNDLAQTIDEINYQFTQHYVLTKNISSLVSIEDMDNSEKNPVTYAIWNRDIEQLQRLHKIHDYRVKYIHGHDSKAVYEQHVRNLDNKLGKTSRSRGLVSHNNLGVHSAFCSHETTRLHDIKKSLLLTAVKASTETTAQATESQTPCLVNIDELSSSSSPTTTTLVPSTAELRISSNPASLFSSSRLLSDLKDAQHSTPKQPNAVCVSMQPYPAKSIGISDI